MNKMKILIGRGNSYKDYTELVSKVTWGGRRGAAPRSLDVTFFASEKLDPKVSINCGEGQSCIFYEDGKERFRGMLMTDSYSSKRTLTVKAYDNCIRLCNNKDSFSYEKKTATAIFSDCCSKLGLPVGSADGTGYVIAELIKKGTTYWDVIEDALSQTYKATGKRFYVSSDGGKVSLKQRKAVSTMPIIELKSNVESYDRTRSIENTRTSIVLLTSKGDKKGSSTNAGLQSKIGKFQEVQTVDEDITQTEIKQIIETFKAEQSIVDQTLSVTATGDISVISGGCVYVYLSSIGVKQVMYVEEDTHTFEKGAHKMKLKLRYCSG